MNASIPTGKRLEQIAACADPAAHEHLIDVEQDYRQCGKAPSYLKRIQTSHSARLADLKICGKRKTVGASE